MKLWINLHHVMYHFFYHHRKNSMQMQRVPANTASKVDVIYIFRCKIQRVQKTQLSLCDCISNTNNRHLEYIYGPIEQYTSCNISFRHIIGITRLIAAYTSTCISWSHVILNSSYRYFLYIIGQSWTIYIMLCISLYLITASL